jgi:hypothetical protein
MRDGLGDRVPPALDHAVHLLRGEEKVSPAWRGRVLRAVASDGAPRQMWSARRRVVSLPAAVAAAIACALAGSATTMAVTRRGTTPAVIAPSLQARAVAAEVLLPVHFSLVAPAAASVSIVGDFNHWTPSALPMKRSADGRTWEIDVKLPEGHYNYAFMIDGRIARDPAAPQTGGDDYGVPNSVLMVSGL